MVSFIKALYQNRLFSFTLIKIDLNASKSNSDVKVLTGKFDPFKGFSFNYIFAERKNEPKIKIKRKNRLVEKACPQLSFNF